MRKKKKLRKNFSALIAFLLLLTSAFLFPLFNSKIFGEVFSNKSSVMVNFIKNLFTSQLNLGSTSGILQLVLIVLFLVISLFYLLNGFGIVYNRYSRYASFLTFAYLIVGLIIYNLLNNQYATSFFGFEISSISLGAGIYFVPIIGSLYLIFYKSIKI